MLDCGGNVMDCGCVGAIEPTASGALHPDAGQPSTGAVCMPRLAPLHSVAECDLEDCRDCWEFWRDEMADSRKGEE